MDRRAGAKRIAGFSAGLRKRTPLGGSWEISHSGSACRTATRRFFVPEQQGNARMSLSFDQPLLNGFGTTYNTALIVLAELDTNLAVDETSAALQQQLTSIAEAYWELYLQRSCTGAEASAPEACQRRSWTSSNDDGTLTRWKARLSAPRQPWRRGKRSWCGQRPTFRHIEAQDTGAHELAGTDGQSARRNDSHGSTRETVRVEVSLQDALVTALQHRPEVDAASQEIRAASVRLNMSRNELLPALDLVLETYVMGLDARL